MKIQLNVSLITGKMRGPNMKWVKTRRADLIGQTRDSNNRSQVVGLMDMKS
jgi:hypothetical protein